MTSNMEMTATKDAAALSAIHVACFAAGWSAETIKSMLEVKGTTALMLDDRSGFTIVRCIEGEAEILTFAVLPKARGRGLGALLVTAIQAHAVLKEGVTTMFLEVAESNAAALAVYRRTGFKVFSRRKHYYQKADGSMEDALLMRVSLPAARSQ